MPKDLSGYDCVFVGFWSDKDQADPKGQEALRQIKNNNVAVFATLHDDPYSDQASKHLRGAVELLKPGSGVIGTYVTWTDKDKYMQVPVDESELNLDQARAFAQDTMSRVQKQ
ncbi:MAG: flavodoxin family protein [Megasphaera massiliensis]